MNSVEASNFFENHVRGRFSKWEPETAEIDDWLFYIKGVEWDIALKAIREHKSESRYNTPALSTFRAKARGFMPPKEKVARPHDTVFVMYDGGGVGTLQPGYYFPVIVLPHEQHLIMKAAENARAKREENVGGTWKIYSQTTPRQMAKMQNEIWAALIESK